MKYSLLILICLVFCFLSSCSSSLYSSPIIASTNVNSVPQHKTLGKVEAGGCQTFVFPFLFLSTNFKKEYDKIFEQAKGMGADGIVNVQIRNKSYTHLLWYLFISDCYTLTGEAVKFTDNSSGWDEQENVNSSSQWDAEPVVKEPEKQEEQGEPNVEESVDGQETNSVWD